MLDIILNGKPALIHIEFQTDYDEEMEVRLLEYNVLASRQYNHRPVRSFVIYLKKGVKVARSPYTRKFPDGQEDHRFSFKVIKLGWVGLLPLLTLTKGGKRPEVVNVMIDTLISIGDRDLLAVSKMAGGMVFKQPREKAWFDRRFGMYQDVLKESWVWQEIEEGGREEERKEQQRLRLQEQRQLLIGFVQTRFPEITDLAKQQTESIQDPETLPPLILKLYAAQTVEEARQFLLSVSKVEEKR